MAWGEIGIPRQGRSGFEVRQDALSVIFVPEVRKDADDDSGDGAFSHWSRIHT